MAEIQEILRKFHQGTASKEELNELLIALDKIQDNAIRHHMRMLFKEDLTHKRAFISDSKAKLIFEKIKENISLTEKDSVKDKKHKKSIYYYMTGIAAAACLALVFYSSILHKPNSRPNNNDKNADFIASLNSKAVFTNTSDTIQHLRLNDGSMVSIYPLGRISCHQPFEKDSRNIFLSGKALFDVAKDKKRPFTVYTGTVSTTALGTHFFVESKDNRMITIKLLSGKIWVRKELASLKGWTHDMILHPGEQMSYSISSGQHLLAQQDFTASISKPSTPVKLIPTNTRIPLDTSVQIDNNGNFNFYHARVGDIFDTLSKRYNTSIHYEKTSFHKMYFSGRTLSTDSLTQILDMISRVNKLSVLPSREGYLIQKKYLAKDSIQEHR